MLLFSQILACRTTDLLLAVVPTATLAQTRTPPIARPIQSPVIEPTNTPVPPPVTAIATDNLRVRGTPSTTAAIVDRLNKGDTAQIIGRTAASDWWQIVLPSNPNARGWISAQFTQTSGPTDLVPVIQAPNLPAPRPYPYP